MSSVKLRFGDLRLEGSSRAGTETWFRVFPPGLAFDAGRGALPLSGANDLFLSHGHLDHALGVPYVLSQRSLHRSQDSRVFCPQPVVEDLRTLVEAAARLEGVDYRYDLLGLEVGDRVPVGKGLVVEAFAVDHVVPSLGYILWRERQHLHPRYAGRTHEELAELRRQGVEITERVEEQALTYCGDTGPGIFERSPGIFDARILLLECTFLTEAHRDRGSRFKHLHVEDLGPLEENFAGETVVLHHLSRRYRLEDLRRALEERFPRLANCTVLVGELRADHPPTPDPQAAVTSVDAGVES